MPAYSYGRHEYGQNFLTDSRVIASLVERVASTAGPLIEIGPGEGALTRPLADTGRPLTAVEIDTRLTEALRRALGHAVTVVNDDFLRYRLPPHPHVIVGNIPFHITTAILRRLLHAPAWTDAVLLMQWEVARRRAGVGASTMMTAQWGPWFTFELGERVPRAAFTPRPGVDGGVLHIRRRVTPLVPTKSRKAFHTLVHALYTGRGRGVVEIITRLKILSSRQAAQAWADRSGVRHTALPSDLSTVQMVSLFESSGVAPPRRRR
ncbi:23S ribosomal RNA methyltransferase Erm [Corynebacterium sp.]|uniref:23S ribosomal RNA methyltransferase Erm n=1 Tax=Corynebacterium sp. TaxID=1720 RepID=UPI0026E07E91|nr:23S ribosomal RNA methyltransferase Erm [Corynebacterium sp.]MDO5511729.1 23S ribosomal RNA methyltransferase Erm [Corynebacterium sp.]